MITGGSKMQFRRWRALLFVVSFLTLFSIIIPESTIKADDLENPVQIEDDSPYEFVDTAWCSLSITSGSASVTSAIEGNSKVTSISITVYLERFNNLKWNDTMSWSHSGTSQYNIDSTNVISGIYRVRMSVTATSGGNTETFDVYGNIALY